jgi:hypothetical protein
MDNSEREEERGRSARIGGGNLAADLAYAACRSLFSAPVPPMWNSRPMSVSQHRRGFKATFTKSGIRVTNSPPPSSPVKRATRKRVSLASLRRTPLPISSGDTAVIAVEPRPRHVLKHSSGTVANFTGPTPPLNSTSEVCSLFGPPETSRTSDEVDEGECCEPDPLARWDFPPFFVGLYSEW